MKSGSTFVAHVLERYFGVEHPDAQIDWSAEHNLSPWIWQVRGIGFCTNFHMLPHPMNLVIAQQEAVQITVIWRNLGDMLLSYDNHVATSGDRPSMCFVLDPERYARMNDSDRRLFLIDTVAPWYIGFYLRWQQAGGRMHAYEVMLEDQLTYFAEIVAGLTGALPDFARLQAALAPPPGAGDRFNVGRAGRSAELFDDRAKRALEDKIFSHPDFEQLEILLWELPWDVPRLEPRKPLDGAVVRRDDGQAFFISRGVAHPIARKSWILGRTGARRLPPPVSAAELAAYPIGETII
jgi:hypothetical protein